MLVEYIINRQTGHERIVNLIYRINELREKCFRLNTTAQILQIILISGRVH